MARFYFHAQEGDQLHKDQHGTDLPDLSAARQEAILAAREVLCHAIKAGQPKVPEAFVIADEAGRMVDVLPLAAVLPDSLKSKS